MCVLPFTHSHTCEQNISNIPSLRELCIVAAAGCRSDMLVCDLAGYNEEATLAEHRRLWYGLNAQTEFPKLKVLIELRNKRNTFERMTCLTDRLIAQHIDTLRTLTDVIRSIHLQKDSSRADEDECRDAQYTHAAIVRCDTQIKTLLQDIDDSIERLETFYRSLMRSETNEIIKSQYETLLFRDLALLGSKHRLIQKFNRIVSSFNPKPYKKRLKLLRRIEKEQCGASKIIDKERQNRVIAERRRAYNSAYSKHFYTWVPLPLALLSIGFLIDCNMKNDIRSSFLLMIFTPFSSLFHNMCWEMAFMQSDYYKSLAPVIPQLHDFGSVADRMKSKGFPMGPLPPTILPTLHAFSAVTAAIIINYILQLLLQA